MFKPMPSANLSKKKQGLIFYICKNYEIQPREIQENIKRLIYDICGKNDTGGYYQKALFEVLTTEKSINNIARNCFCSPRSVCYWRKMFYNAAESYGVIPKSEIVKN